MKYKSLFIYFVLTFGFIKAQDIQNGIDIKLTQSLTSHNLTVSIHSTLFTLDNCKFNIINVKGKKVKTFKLSDKNNNVDTIIELKDIGYGEYSYTITNKKEQLYSGKFIKDVYDNLNF